MWEWHAHASCPAWWRVCVCVRVHVRSRAWPGAWGRGRWQSCVYRRELNCEHAGCGADIGPGPPVPGQLLWGCHLEGWAASGVFSLECPLFDSDPGPPTQDFDRLLEALRAALAKDPGTGFVFSCLSGQGRTTTAMVVAVLAFWHIQVCMACPA